MFFQKIITFFKNLCYTEVNAVIEFAAVIGMFRDDRLAFCMAGSDLIPTAERFAHEQ